MAQVQLNGADLGRAHLEDADLSEAQLRGAFLGGAWLYGADLLAARLEGADLGGAHLNEALLGAVNCEGVGFTGADLRKAGLTGAYLAGTYFHAAHLEGAYLEGVQMQGKVLGDEELASIQKWKADFPATLPPANLWQATFDPETVLDSAILGDEAFGGIFVGDVRWGGVNLTVIDWTPIMEIGEERAARTLQSHDDLTSDVFQRERLRVYERAVRANRQLAAVLRAQGLNEVADRFNYRAQNLQRKVFLLQRAIPSWLFSLFLWVVSGYGYRLRNILMTYVCVLLVFTVIYALMGVHSFRGESGIQALWDSFLVSLSAIHGRTTFEQLGAWSGTAWVAAVESVCGLVIEGVFIAMLTQRFFAR